MRPFLLRTSRRVARLLGYDLQRLYEPGEACVIRLAEIRAALPKLDPEARQFLGFAFEHLAASKAQTCSPSMKPG